MLIFVVQSFSELGQHFPGVVLVSVGIALKLSLVMGYYPSSATDRLTRIPNAITHIWIIRA